jgi:hypothetical protein
MDGAAFCPSVIGNYDFEDFENTIDQSWSLAATKASHRRQLGK